jgi:hypothetical protein
MKSSQRKKVEYTWRDLRKCMFSSTSGSASDFWKENDLKLKSICYWFRGKNQQKLKLWKQKNNNAAFKSNKDKKSSQKGLCNIWVVFVFVTL